MRRSQLDDRLLVRGFTAIKRWTCRFPIGDAAGGGDAALGGDRYFEAWSSCGFAVEGKRVLELGPLEGAQTAALCQQGAAEVVAIEGHAGNFVKCCVVKNALGLDRATFVFDDFRRVAPETYGTFDVVLASGVLYHVEDPAALLARLASVSPVVLLWTHVARGEYPLGRPVEVELGGRSYRGKWYRERRTPRAGLQPRSFWPYLEDLRRMCEDNGFAYVDEIEVDWTHRHGAAWLGVLWRDRSLKPADSVWLDAREQPTTEPDAGPGRWYFRYQLWAPRWVQHLARRILPERLRRRLTLGRRS